MAETKGMEERQVRVPAGTVMLEGGLAVPDGARGVVLFAHGSGSSRHSPRNRFVAGALREGGLATLLVDLLTAEEEAVDARTRQLRFDIGLLAERLVGAIDWLAEQPGTRGLPVGLFGASTGGGAALVAAAARPDAVAAVVSRGGRPDLAGDALPHVRAPSLLIVGGDDEPVIGLNRRAAAQMRAPVTLEIVPGATHLFEEPGTLERVASLAREWFVRHLVPEAEPADSPGAIW
jgi:putative phosphoribosyl transferase